MSTSPFISAIVPCFNVGSLLERTIDSLRSQTLPPREILVIDDASTSAETLSALEAVQSIPSVTVLRQPANQGVAAARNRGLDTCRGDFAVFLDADDLFTAPSLAAFHDALANAPDASFAYPTVTCFGNRNDTFPAPEFNAYLLHHANICPIASMITRGAIDSGVRFDTAISVGHEDWDYWLRLVDAGHLGCAAPDAVLLYRRVGFTRNDLGNQMEGGFDSRLRAMRPELFDTQRLLTLKRRWAPGLSLITTDRDRAERLVTHQTCQDIEVLEWADAEVARGRIIAFEWSGSDEYLRSDPFAIEDTLAMGHFLAADQLLVSIKPDCMRPGTPSGIPLATDTQRGWVKHEDLAAAALPASRAGSLISEGWAACANFVLDQLRRAGVAAAHRILWRAGQNTAIPALRTGHPVPLQNTHPVEATETRQGWTRKVLTGLPLAAPWAVASPDAAGLFGLHGPSSLRCLAWVEDPFGGRSLYGQDEPLLVGSTTVEHGPAVQRSAMYGAVPLRRVENNLTHQRSITCTTVPLGSTLQEVLGYVESGAAPGTRRLTGPGLNDDPSQAGGGRVFTTLRDRGRTWPHSSDLLFEARVIWRGQRRNGAFVYGLSAKEVERWCEHPPGQLLVVNTEARSGREAALRLILGPDSVPIGLTTGAVALAGGQSLGPHVGYIETMAREGYDQRPVFIAHTREGSSQICSASVDEIRTWSSAAPELLGYSPLCLRDRA